MLFNAANALRSALLSVGSIFTVKVALPAKSVVCSLPCTLTPFTLSMISLTTLPVAALPLGRLPDTWILKLSFKTLIVLGIEVELNVVLLTLTSSLIRIRSLVTALTAPDSSMIVAVNTKLLAAASLSFCILLKPAGTRTV